MRIPVLTVPVLLLVLPACEPAGSSAEWGGTIDTLESGIEVVHNPAEGIWDSSTAWRLVEDLRIGSVEGEGPETFAQIVDLAIDVAGRIYVLDRQAQEIRVFAANGEYVRTIGRPGSGPGELRGAFGIAVDPEGRLWVADWSNSRYAVFDTNGRYLAGPRRSIRCRAFRWWGGILLDGRVYDWDCATTPDGRTNFLGRYDTTLAELRDTLLLPSPDTEPSYVFTFDGTELFIGVPFTPQFTWTLDPRGFVWIAHSAEYRIAQVGLDGDTVRVIERAVEPPPVSATERADALERIREAARGQSFDESRIPDHKPYFENLLATTDGYVLVRRVGDGDSTRFDTFEPQGRFLGTLAADFRTSDWLPVWFHNNALYAIDRDELDVPYVVRYRIDNR